MESTDDVLPSEAKNVTVALFKDLNEITSKHSSGLLLVHLPNADDYTENFHTDSLRTTLRQLSTENELSYLDIVEVIQGFPSNFDAESLFQYGNQHYNLAGNQFIARHIQPEIEKAFSGQ